VLVLWMTIVITLHRISYASAFLPNDSLSRKRIASNRKWKEYTAGDAVPQRRSRSQPCSTIAHSSPSSSAAELERMKAHFEKLRKQQRLSQRALDYRTANVVDPMGVERERIYQSYILRPASDLKQELARRQLNSKGRKPDLAHRLTQDDLISSYGLMDHGKGESEYFEEYDEIGTSTLVDAATSEQSPLPSPAVVTSFAGLSPLSEAASSALTMARFVQPSKIQSKAIPVLRAGQSAILHAATGSGKTLAYLLPLTERLWSPTRDSDEEVALVLTPTRELAAQVASVATVLAPPGTVRFVNRPSNLMSRLRQENAWTTEDATTTDRDARPRIYVGSAKTIYESLYGDGKMPAPPTTKPQAMFLLKNTAYLVLDEVDRLLDVVGGSSSASKYSRSADPTPEQPAAVLTAAVARLTLGKAVTVAASATVGRPLRRELARCLGLTPQECPPILRENSDDDNTDTELVVAKPEDDTTTSSSTVLGRAVTIPETVRHYIIPVEDGSSPGKILTFAYTAIQSLGPTKRMLLVLTRNFGITTQNVIGALKHFKCQPEPISLVDALETTEGTEAMMQLHRQVTGVSGVGGTAGMETDGESQPRGYLLITGEDSIRGLHLDGLDVVLVAARSVGPDEYTHIAGRTGRAGQSGHVVNIVNQDDVQKVKAWENMLNIRFRSCANPKSIADILKNADE
jgi:superfamily II DNA/RNA helicase